MIYTAFIFGLISSLHCIGMCGPIAMMLPLDRSNPTKKALQILIYHLGRITAYAGLGLIFGLLGKGLFLAGIQQKTSIIIGIVMIVIAIVPEKVFARYNFSKPVFHVISKVKSGLGNQFRKKSLSSIYTIGLLNGFLPCGLVYTALFGALAMQNEWYGTTYMALYGLGTIPMMSAVVYMGHRLGHPIRNKINKIVPIVTAGIGVLFILRGLGIGISYVSPSDVSLFVQSTPNCH
ncbi:sulfite exporter TauE/SafE family protein [Flavobacterium terrisoli]|uniref:sulfite exporter TauE/SafE family protein n=1 Tax=Flavobacterium terrisoli TaxID=3242195 RepID=UPI0025431128|nr:sulfite exporter TauE/SafE family protein [Flavobacterium buctense]